MTCSAYAQISLGTSDFPSAGDIYRMSVANQLAGANYSLTGPGYTWDFSQLTPQSQRLDTFLSVSATSAVFNVVFANFSFNPNRANVATGGADFNLGTVAVNDVFNFFYNSSASYTQVGFGATISGIPAPFTYNPKDVVYSFPLNFGDIDTSFSSYNVDLSSTLGLYFRVNRTRINQVDGWGTLITPYGTNNVLRVKTTVTERDSVHIDSLGFGFNLPPITTNEYKWMAAGEGVPLLQANANASGTVNQVVYRDNTPFNTTVQSIETTLAHVDLYPNPASDQVSILPIGFNGETNFTLLDLQGKIVLERTERLLPGLEIKTVRLSLEGVAAGHYVLHVRSADAAAVKSLTVR